MITYFNPHYNADAYGVEKTQTAKREREMEKQNELLNEIERKTDGRANVCLTDSWCCWPVRRPYLKTRSKIKTFSLQMYIEIRNEREKNQLATANVEQASAQKTNR